MGMEHQEKVGGADDYGKIIHAQWSEIRDKIEELGYRDMPMDKYLKWVTAMDNEKQKQAQEYAEVK